MLVGGGKKLRKQKATVQKDRLPTHSENFTILVTHIIQGKWAVVIPLIYILSKLAPKNIFACILSLCKQQVALMVLMQQPLLK